jgi:hypothetical protein
MYIPLYTYPPNGVEGQKYIILQNFPARLGHLEDPRDPLGLNSLQGQKNAKLGRQNSAQKSSPYLLNLQWFHSEDHIMFRPLPDCERCRLFLHV